MSGRVYLVGAGPGDPGLLTVRGQRLLAAADVVVTDHLVPPALLASARPGARVIEVGRPHGEGPRLAQHEIEALLIEHARAGRSVVRLKNGDPMLFGRGAEEATALDAAGVPFEIVPGVTAALSVPIAAGIPVSHRDFASSVALVTGHRRDDARSERREGDAGRAVADGMTELDWGALARIDTSGGEPPVVACQKELRVCL